MIHPLIHLAISHPELLAEHGEAYVALVGKELSNWRASVVRRIVMGVVAGLAALLALIFIGVAVMLWGASSDDIRSPWLLIAPPALMVIVTIVAGLMAAKGGLGSPLFTDVKAQVRADLAMLREVNAE